MSTEHDVHGGADVRVEWGVGDAEHKNDGWALVQEMESCAEGAGGWVVRWGEEELCIVEEDERRGRGRCGGYIACEGWVQRWRMGEKEGRGEVEEAGFGEVGCVRYGRKEGSWGEKEVRRR